jgi:hypothetical protein
MRSVHGHQSFNQSVTRELTSENSKLILPPPVVLLNVNCCRQVQNTLSAVRRASTGAQPPEPAGEPAGEPAVEHPKSPLHAALRSLRPRRSSKQFGPLTREDAALAAAGVEGGARLVQVGVIMSHQQPE